MEYIITLGLGLFLLYTLRDYFLDLQNRRDEREKAVPAHSSIIIHSNEEYCKENTKISA